MTPGNSHFLERLTFISTSLTCLFTCLDCSATNGIKQYDIFNIKLSETTAFFMGGMYLVLLHLVHNQKHYAQFEDHSLQHKRRQKGTIDSQLDIRLRRKAWRIQRRTHRPAKGEPAFYG